MLLRPGENCWRVDRAGRVRVLIDMQAYFSAIKSSMLKAERSLMLVGWAFDPLTLLEPHKDGRGPKSDEAGPFMHNLAGEKPGLDARVLIWKSALPIAASQHFFPHRARKCFNGTRVSFRLDETVPFGACHHQKILTVDDTVAYSGGGDICVDRFDTPAHPDLDTRRRMPFGGFHDPRHETMCVVDGPAAVALADLARERWETAAEETVPPPPAGDYDPWPDDVEAELTDIPMGISRTVPRWRDQAPIRESEKLHLACIAAAKVCIYLENQYLTSPVIGEALAARLSEPDGPEVVIVSTAHAPSWFDGLTMDTTRSLILKRLQLADVHGRLHAYCPRTPGGRTIIVHSKVTVIDDCLLRVGSTNLNNRSFGFDTEVDIAFEAETDIHRAAIVRFRNRTLAHFLGTSVEDFSAAVAEHGTVAAAIKALDDGQIRRLRRLGAVRIGAFARLIATYHLGDPASVRDSWRPWRRRHDLYRDLQRMAPAAVAPFLREEPPLKPKRRRLLPRRIRPALRP